MSVVTSFDLLLLHTRPRVAGRACSAYRLESSDMVALTVLLSFRARLRRS